MCSKSYIKTFANLMECINVAALKPLRNSTRHLMRLFDCIQSKRKQGTMRTIELNCTKRM